MSETYGMFSVKGHGLNSFLKTALCCAVRRLLASLASFSCHLPLGFYSCPSWDARIVFRETLSEDLHLLRRVIIVLQRLNSSLFQ